MNCEHVRKQLLALEDPQRVPENLRAHVIGCSTCGKLVGQVARLDDLISRLPHPKPMPTVKAAFLNRLQAPVADASPDPLSFTEPGFSQPRKYRRLRPGTREWRIAATLSGLAAGIMVAAVVWSGVNAKRGSGDKREETAVRHELLKKEVGHLVALAQADSPSKRMTIRSQIATEFRSEASTVYRAAPADEMAALAKMYEKAVRDGIVPQAEQLPHYISTAERRDLLSVVTKKLTETEIEAERLASQAPPQSQPSLKRIAQTAREGRTKLEDLTRG